MECPTQQQTYLIIYFSWLLCHVCQANIPVYLPGDLVPRDGEDI